MPKSQRLVDQMRAHYRERGVAFERPPEEKTIREAVSERYDDLMSRRSSLKIPTGFMNLGYWYRHTTTTDQASEALMEKLIGPIADRSGTILDVACGLGATSRHLCRHWAPERVTGVNITEKQIARCRELAPGCEFKVMDAANMTFGDASFDNVICVEAACHFDTREKFLRDTLRILKPGGALALTDCLVHPDAGALVPRFPSCNFDVDSPAAYRDLAERVGFSRVEVVDITEEGVRSYARFTVADLHDEWLSGQIDFTMLQNGLQSIYSFAAAVKHNVMCFAWR